MKALLLVCIFIGLSADMFNFDQMREQFVDQVEVMTETSDLPLTKERDEVLQGRELRLDKKEIQKQKELKRMRENADKMQARIKKKEDLKAEVKRGGNTYLGITMNMLSDVPRNTKYLGLDRSWTKRTNTNGVGIISLSGLVAQEDVMKYHSLVQKKYTFVKTKAFKTPDSATNAYFYTNEGDSIILSVETTQYKKPVLYKMILEYTSKEELTHRRVKIQSKEKIQTELDSL